MTGLRFMYLDYVQIHRICVKGTCVAFIAILAIFMVSQEAAAQNSKNSREIIDAAAFRSFSACKTSSLSAGKTIVVSKQTSVNNCTVPKDRSVRMLKGGAFVISAGKTLTFKGTFEAGSIQVFAGSSSVNFSTGSVKEVLPQWWGAKGDGTTDDTASIQAAVNSISNVLDGKVLIPASITPYMIKATGASKLGMTDGGIIIRNPMNFVLHPAATLKAIAGNKNGSCIINIRSAKDVVISGGNIVGDRASHNGSTGEHGMGIIIDSSNNITVKDVRVSDCWGDGIGLRYEGGKPNTHIRIINVKCNNNRRQGLTIGSSSDVVVSGSEFSNTNGTAPEAGIDIEPNNADAQAIDIKIHDCIFKGNKGFHIVMGGGAGCNNVKVYKNVFIDPLKYSIALSANKIPAENVIISENEFIAGNNNAIHIFLSGTINTKIEKNIIHQIEKTKVSVTGIYLYQENKSLQITANTIEGVNDGIITTKSDHTDITVKENKFRFAGHGIKVNTAIKGGLISNNSFMDIGKQAIIGKMINLVIKDNAFATIGTENPDKFAIIDVTAENCIIENNIFNSTKSTQLAIKSTAVPTIASIFKNNSARYGTSQVFKINPANVQNNNLSLH